MDFRCFHSVFDDDRYFDVFVEYAKADPEDVLIRITAYNQGPESAVLYVLPMVSMSARKNTTSKLLLNMVEKIAFRRRAALRVLSETSTATSGIQPSRFLPRR